MVDSLGNWRKTHYSIDLSPKMAGEEVKIGGWVQRGRDLGGLRFIILHYVRFWLILAFLLRWSPGHKIHEIACE